MELEKTWTGRKRLAATRFWTTVVKYEGIQLHNSMRYGLIETEELKGIDLPSGCDERIKWENVILKWLKDAIFLTKNEIGKWV